MEGSFKIEGDPVWMENLLRYIDGKPKKEQTYQVTLTSFHQVPCPSLWRHPLRWLRWNPLMMTRIIFTMNGVTLDRNDDGSMNFHPPLLINEPH
jgi:hypothetical protein